MSKIGGMLHDKLVLARMRNISFHTRVATCNAIILILLLSFAGLAGGRHGLGTVLSSYVLPINDLPGDVSPTCARPLVLGHYFGDFQSDFCRAKIGRIYSQTGGIEVITELKSRYKSSPSYPNSKYVSKLSPSLHLAIERVGLNLDLSSSEVNALTYAIESGGIPPDIAVSEIEKLLTKPSWYPPSFYIITWPIYLANSLVVSFAITILIALSLWIVVIRSRVLRPAWTTTVLAVLPIAFGFLRGNTGWILATPLFALFLFRQRSGDSGWVFLLMASALKPQLALLTLVFAVNRQFRSLIYVLGGLITLNVAGALVFINSKSELLQLVGRYSGTVPSADGLRYDLKSLFVKLQISKLDQRLISSIFNDGGQVTINRVLIVTILSMVTLYLVILVLPQEALKIRLDKRPCLDSGEFILVLTVAALIGTAPTFFYSLGLLTVILMIVPLATMQRSILSIVCLPILIPPQFFIEPTIALNSTLYRSYIYETSIGSIVNGLLLLYIFTSPMSRLIANYFMSIRTQYKHS